MMRNDNNLCDFMFKLMNKNAPVKATEASFKKSNYSSVASSPYKTTNN